MSENTPKPPADATATLGLILGERETRDAIHFAVVPIVAAERLIPGEHVGPDGTTRNPVGIVDPFLKAHVRPGERFWLVLYPRTITGLRHVWTHPAFPDDPVALEATAIKPTRDESEAWLRAFCSQPGPPSFDVLMSIAVDGNVDSLDDDPDYPISAVFDGEYWCFSGIDTHGVILDEFWPHLENYTGKTFKNRPAYFTCSC